MARGRSDIANTALRIFLQELGAAYDESRGLAPYKGGKDFEEVVTFFADRCCYCSVEFVLGNSAVQDHLVPMNKSDLGLHAWGNVVPACSACNANKHGRDWREFVIERAGEHARERHQKMKSFVDHYKYRPSLQVGEVAMDLYEEVGSLAMVLINLKVKRARLVVEDR